MAKLVLYGIRELVWQLLGTVLSSAVETSGLQVTGFASSGLFGTFTGCLADSLGRRNMALVFTLVYALSALCKERNQSVEPSLSFLTIN